MAMKATIASILNRARHAAPTAALASSLLCPSALGAPGDLDPTFGDVGRLGPLTNLIGPVWSVAMADGAFCSSDDDCIAFGGGEYFPEYDGYYAHDASASGFLSRVFQTGSIDPNFSPRVLADTQVRDVAVYPDGRVVGVGQTLEGASAKLTVFRLNIDGTPDPGFGMGGIVHLVPAGNASLGNSVVLEADGRIVVAGVRDDRLIVLRLLANGAIDRTFAGTGIFTGSRNVNGPTLHRDFTTNYLLPRIVRVANGGYRITNNNDFDCRVLALTASGAVDQSFGASGLAGLALSPEEVVACNSMAVQTDGRLLIAGSRQVGRQGVVVRLLSSGNRDATF
jgi:uncharacterized delta-60 repeat protein